MFETSSQYLYKNREYKHIIALGNKILSRLLLLIMFAFYFIYTSFYLKVKKKKILISIRVSLKFLIIITHY